ncbi:MAG: hypothetical protein HZB39_03485 [Planctomycetes bacterium]|nr:hypothetical protein [Planctomycetota bacterium]
MARRVRCSACHRLSTTVRVHGHEQCSICGSNFEPCCGGAGEEFDALSRGGESADIDALVAVLAGLGGATTREDLLNWFAERTAASLLLSAQVLERARSAGRVVERDGVVALVPEG